MIDKIKQSAIFPIMQKEFIHIVRDTRTLLITFAIPVVMLVLYGYALTFDIKNIPLAVRDMDNTSFTRQIIEKFKASGYFVVVKNVSSYKEEEKLFLSGKISAAVNIDDGFTSDVISKRGGVLQVVVDGADANTAVVASGYINGILQDITKGMIAKTFSFGTSLRSVDDLIPLDAKIRVWYNPELRSANFLVPGIISMVLMILAALITSLSIVSEKTRGTMEQLLASPIKPIEIMIGKLLPYVVIGFGDVLLCVSIGNAVFKVPIKGDVVLLFVESIIFIFGSLGLGLLISTMAKRQEDSVLLGVMTTMLPSILLSGFVFPIDSMPRVIQLVTYLVPARYFLNILRGIFMKGVGLKYLWPDTLLLIVFGVLMLALSAKQFKKRLD